MSNDLFNPNQDNKSMLMSFRRTLIQQHPTFFCPITKEILDYRKSHIVKFSTPDGKEKTDVISHTGWKKLPSDIKERANMRVIENFDDL